MSQRAKAAGTTTRRVRGSLSEEEILAAAIELVERDGLEGLSMPNLARHLGAGVMSLYWYFHSKEELLGAMAEHAMQEVYSRLPPVGDGPWADEVTRLTRAYAEELRRTPLFAQLCRSRPRLLAARPGALGVLARRVDEELEVLQRLGLSVAEAMSLHLALVSFTIGFVVMELGADQTADDPTVEEILEASVARLDAAEFPTLRSVTDLGALVAVTDDEFNDVLELLVTGVQSERGQALS